VTRRNEPWPEIPGEAEARRQEAEDRRELDRIDALLAHQPDERERAVLDLADEATERWEQRNGMRPAPRYGMRSSREIAEEGKRTHWPQATRQAYIDALDREDVVRAASRTYGGAA
jgi:hypothetical protein